MKNAHLVKVISDLKELNRPFPELSSELFALIAAGEALLASAPPTEVQGTEHVAGTECPHVNRIQ